MSSTHLDQHYITPGVIHDCSWLKVSKCSTGNDWYYCDCKLCWSCRTSLSEAFLEKGSLAFGVSTTTTTKVFLLCLKAASHSVLPFDKFCSKATWISKDSSHAAIQNSLVAHLPSQPVSCCTCQQFPAGKRLWQGMLRQPSILHRCQTFLAKVKLATVKHL